MPLTASPAARDLSGLFHPRGVAVVGASPGKGRIGAQALAALRTNGYAGGIYPVNTKYDEIEGLRCYRSIAEVPQPCDLAIVCIAGNYVADTLIECGKAGISFAVVFSSGFDEIGEKGAKAQAELEDAIRRSGVGVVGPNCQGIMNLRERALCGFGAIFLNNKLKPGPVAMVSQSGGFGYGVLGYAQYAGIGFDYVASTGNETDINTLDFLEYFIEQDEVKIIATYLEGVRDGHRLRRLGMRALELGKPILVWKVGNTGKGRQAAASHTANVTSDYQFYQTAFASGAFLEIHEVDDLIDIARAFAGGRLPAGNRAAVLTVSGGAGVLFADRCEQAGIELGTLTDESRAALKEFLPEYAALDNPFDLTAQVLNDVSHFNRAVRIVANDPNIDLVLMRAAQSLAKGEQLEILAEISRTSGKPILVAWGAPPDRTSPEILALERLGVPWHSTPGRATFAASALVKFAERYRGGPPPEPVPENTVPWPFSDAKPGQVIDEHDAKRFLESAGIPAVPEALLTLEQILKLEDLPFAPPMVLKIRSPDIHHKTEVGGVILNLKTLDELKQAAARMSEAVARHAPEARIEGMLVQRQVSGREVIIGVRNDPHFGPLVMVGLGGVFVELIKDVSYGYAPLQPAQADRMLRDLKSYQLLSGYRGEPAADIPALVDVLVRVGALAHAHRDRIAEIDINPVIVSPAGEGVHVADALIVVAGEPAAGRDGRGSHG